MTSRIAALAIDAVEPRVVAGFWRAVLGWREVEADAVGITIAPTDRDWPTIDVFAVPERKGVKNRLHLDLRADGCTTAEELKRLLDLGARRADVGQGPDVSWVVLADPEGNEFCLLATHGPGSGSGGNACSGLTCHRADGVDRGRDRVVHDEHRRCR